MNFLCCKSSRWLIGKIWFLWFPMCDSLVWCFSFARSVTPEWNEFWHRWLLCIDIFFSLSNMRVIFKDLTLTLWACLSYVLYQPGFLVWELNSVCVRTLERFISRICFLFFLVRDLLVLCFSFTRLTLLIEMNFGLDGFFDVDKLFFLCLMCLWRI